MFHTNTSINVLRVNRHLKKLGENGIPLAANETLNNLAAGSRKISIRKFAEDHIIRSNWTERGMLFEKAKRGIPIAQMESRSGNIRDYAARLEKGEILRASGQAIEVPTTSARISKSKRKRIAKRFSMPQLQRLRRMPNVSGSPKRKFAAMMNLARKDNYFGPFLISRREAGGERIPTGIFMLTNAGRKNRGGGKITRIRSMQSKVVIKGNPFVGPAGAIMGKSMDKIYIKNAEKLIGRKVTIK
jgi:hypothetical protein